MSFTRITIADPPSAPNVNEGSLRGRRSDPATCSSRQRRLPLGRHWLSEALVIAALYAAYTGVRDAIHGAGLAAVGRGRRIEFDERRFHLDPEHALNRLVASHPVLATICNYDYAIAHFAVTAAALVALYWRRGREARPFALALYATNLLALIGFYCYPLAPPRLLPGAGFVDTVVAFHTWGSWGSNTVTSVANQYAAMPSLHVAWACWAAVAIWSLTSSRWLRGVAVAYPIWTVFVVLGTANHYLTDVLAGLVTVAAGFGLVLGVTGLWRRATGGPTGRSAMEVRDAA